MVNIFGTNEKSSHFDTSIWDTWTGRAVMIGVSCIFPPAAIWYGILFIGWRESVAIRNNEALRAQVATYKAKNLPVQTDEEYWAEYETNRPAEPEYKTDMERIAEMADWEIDDDY